MLWQLRSFLAALEEGSLHRAAARLSISQSALSRQIQALEHEVGGKLLERSSTGVLPTQGGRLLAERMAPFLMNFDASLLAVRAAIRGEADELRIGYLASAYQEYLEPALEQLHRRHPKTKVKLLDLFPGEIITALRRGEIDLALMQDGGKMLGKSFFSKRLAVNKSFVCLPRSHALSSRKSLKIADLRNETFLIAPDSKVPGQRRRLMHVCRSCGKFRPKIVEGSGDLSDAFSAIANDGAVAILPAFLRRQKRPGVVMVPISDAAATWELFVAWPRENSSKPLLTLLDFLPFAK